MIFLALVVGIIGVACARNKMRQFEVVPGASLLDAAVLHTSGDTWINVQAPDLKQCGVSDERAVAYVKWQVGGTPRSSVEIWAVSPTGNGALWLKTGDDRGTGQTGRWVSDRTLFVLVDPSTHTNLASHLVRGLNCGAERP